MEIEIYKRFAKKTGKTGKNSIIHNNTCYIQKVKTGKKPVKNR